MPSTYNNLVLGVLSNMYFIPILRNDNYEKLMQSCRSTAISYDQHKILIASKIAKCSK